MPSAGPSAHLDWEELACHDGTPYPQVFIDDDRVFCLAAAFEAVRLGARVPLTILSAYRTSAYNASVGGAPHSQHLEGRALDLLPPKTITPTQLYRLIHLLAQTQVKEIRGIGLYDTFVHMDIRPVVDIVSWDLRKVKAIIA